MEFIWIGLFFVVLIFSFLLAMRSMKNFQEIPLSHLQHSLFLIQNPTNLNIETIKQIYSLSKELDAVISFEKLAKGNEMVIALYAPKQFQSQLGSLQLLELEDYVGSEDDLTGKKITKNEALPWVIAPKNSKKDIQVEENFFNQISLSDRQHFFWQIVASPLKNDNLFQVTIRAMVAEKDPAIRVEVAKRVDQLINQATGLIKESRQQSSGLIFDSYAKRTITPKEVSKFEMSGEEILKLLG